MLKDKSGNLYGTTSDGGTGDSGTVFEIRKNGTLTALCSFPVPGSDGQYPSFGTLIEDSAGNLFGTTDAGGAYYYGAVYKLAPDGTETVLHPFTGGSDGNTPEAGVIADGKGNLYGTTNNGGTYGYGTVFELAPDGTETVLYSFTGGSDGAFPAAGLLRIAGNLYSVTSNGGARGAGTVFESRRGKRAPGPKGSCTLSPAAPTAAIPTPT